MLRTRMFQLLALLVALSLVGLSPLAADDHDLEEGNGEENGNEAVEEEVEEEEDELEDEPDAEGVVRISGPNRFVTAAALAAETHKDGAEHVFLATGGEFADALTGAPAAAYADAPMLFTPPGRLHKDVEALLDEWKPAEVTILGGSAAVGKPIERQLKSLGVDEINRLGGGNRYETAVEISQWIENGGAAASDDDGVGVSKITMLDEPAASNGSVIYLATGGRFPDALVGATVAVAEGGSVLLTGVDGLPEATAEWIQELGPSKIVALGGEKAVSEDVLDDALELAGDGAEKYRIAGGDRYETAVAVSEHLTGENGADLVYVATGVGWADAVAGAAAAGSGGVPVLLVRPSDVPEVVANELTRLLPGTVRVLGGPAAITGRVAEALKQILADAADDQPDTIEDVNGDNGNGDGDNGGDNDDEVDDDDDENGNGDGLNG